MDQLGKESEGNDVSTQGVSPGSAGISSNEFQYAHPASRFLWLFLIKYFNSQNSFARIVCPAIKLKDAFLL